MQQQPHLRTSFLRTCPAQAAASAVSAPEAAAAGSSHKGLHVLRSSPLGGPLLLADKAARRSTHDLSENEEASPNRLVRLSGRGQGATASQPDDAYTDGNSHPSTSSLDAAIDLGVYPWQPYNGPPREYACTETLAPPPPPLAAPPPSPPAGLHSPPRQAPPLPAAGPGLMSTIRGAASLADMHALLTRHEADMTHPLHVAALLARLPKAADFHSNLFPRLPPQHQPLLERLLAAFTSPALLPRYAARQLTNALWVLGKLGQGRRQQGSVELLLDVLLNSRGGEVMRAANPQVRSCITC